MASFGGVAIGEIGYATDPPAAATLYLLDNSNSVLYKSTDQGATFSSIQPGSFFTATFDVLRVAGNDLVVAADFSANVKVSSNGGTSWSDVTDWQVFASFPEDISIIDANTWIFAGGTSRRTTNAGSSWANDPAAASSVGIKAAPAGAKIWGIDSGDDTKTKRFNLDGSGAETFAHGTNDPPGRAVISDSLAFAINNGASNTNINVLWVVNGASSSSILPPAAMTNAYFAAAWAPTDGSIWLALCWDFNLSSTPSNVGQLWRSTDDGASWTKVKEDHALQPVSHSQGKNIAVDPNDSQKWWVCGGNGYDSGDGTLWKSTDGGLTWTSSVPISGCTLLGAIKAVGD